MANIFGLKCSRSCSDFFHISPRSYMISSAKQEGHFLWQHACKEARGKIASNTGCNKEWIQENIDAYNVPNWFYVLFLRLSLCMSLDLTYNISDTMQWIMDFLCSSAKGLVQPTPFVLDGGDFIIQKNNLIFQKRI